MEFSLSLSRKQQNLSNVLSSVSLSLFEICFLIYETEEVSYVSQILSCLRFLRTSKG